jgi:hypothetical protein
MSIDLLVHSPPHGRLQLCQLVERAARKAEELTHFAPPRVLIEELVRGTRVRLVDEFADTHGKTFILSWAESNDAVSLTVVDGDEPGVILSFSVGATRSPTEYVLGLVAALATGELLSADVCDPALFWSAQEVITADAMRNIFQGGRTFDEACELAAASRGA